MPFVSASRARRASRLKYGTHGAGLRLFPLEALERRQLFSTYYVAPNGNDAGDGSLASPFQRLQVAVSNLHAGDTLNIEAGTYTEGIICGWDDVGLYGTINGTAAAPIIIQADPTAAPGSVILTGANNKTQVGISLEPGNSWIVFKGITVINENGSIRGDGIRVSHSDNVSIINCTVTGMLRFGIFSSFTQNLLIEGNHVFDNPGVGATSGHGIYVSDSADHPIIRGNVISGNGSQGIHLNGDISDGGTGMITGALIENNFIFDNVNNGINADGLKDSVIQNNLIYNNTKNGIVFYHIDAAFGSTGNLIINNTVVQPSSGGAAIQLVSGSTNNAIYNNILVGGTLGTINISDDSLPGLVSDYNAVSDLYHNDDSDEVSSLDQWRSMSGQDAHSFVAILGDLFANAVANDYHLSPTSPALDYGRTSPYFTPAYDILGRDALGVPIHPRPDGAGIDLGAFEGSQLPQSDTTAPLGTVTVQDLLRGRDTYTFTVTYTDDSAVNTQTIGPGNVYVTGPGGYLQTATFVSVNLPGNGSRRIATYQITAPGGLWDPLDNGVYSIFMNPGQVSDVAVPAHSVAGGLLGTFAVNIVLDGTVAARNIMYRGDVYGDFAEDKTALLPGQTATFANYSSFDRGINVVVIDVDGPIGTLTTDDFTFKVGNDSNPAAWSAAPLPLVDFGQGDSPGISRIFLYWDDGLIRNEWLQVTVLSNPNTGLSADDVFYFGNAVGESGDSTTDAKVTATDQIAARAHATAPDEDIPITNQYDYNRDGKVDADDEAIARANTTNFLGALKLITIPGFFLASAAVPENAPAGTAAGTLLDANLQAGDHYSYSLVGGWGSSGNSSFVIAGNTLLTVGPFDFEANASYSIRVRGTNADSVIERVFTIDVLDVNEPPTALVLSGATVLENQPVGTAVGSLATIDDDAGDTCTYALVDGPGNQGNVFFTIAGNQLFTSASFDFEKASSQMIRVRTTDRAGQYFETNFVITILNANDAPVGIRLASGGTVPEHQPIPTLAATFSTDDPDLNDAWTYTLVPGAGSDDNASFALVDNQLWTAGVFDVAAKSTYTVRVRSTDKSGAFVEAAFDIAVSASGAVAFNSVPMASELAAPLMMATESAPGATLGAVRFCVHGTSLAIPWLGRHNGFTKTASPPPSYSNAITFKNKSSEIIADGPRHSLLIQPVGPTEGVCDPITRTGHPKNP